MKSANQNEMEVLLRSLARRDGGILSGRSGAGAGAGAESHLDADELNAFAEGMVTERARARYSAHLADCTDCRSLVVNLTQSSGVNAPRIVTEEKQATSFWHQVAAFFSHPVLRFVIPAVVLVSILGIGLLALRQDGSGEFIAQHDPSQQPTSGDQINQAAPSQTSTPTEPTATPAPAVAPVVPDLATEARRRETAGGTGGVGASEGSTTMRKEADAQPSQVPTFAPDVSAAAPPPPPAAYSQRDQTQTLARQEARKREDEAVRVGEPPTPTTDSHDTRSKAATAASSTTNQPKPGRTHGLMREGRSNEDKDKNKSDTSERTDSRTVSGKRFVRQNNAWVDSAYQQSRATTNVKRGSEQYRALISDEPALRSFSEQLSGEVIVVWKGRAYKFY